MSTPITDEFKVKLKTTCGEKFWVPVDTSIGLENTINNLKQEVENIKNLYKEKCDEVLDLKLRNSNLQMNNIQLNNLLCEHGILEYGN